MAAAAVAVLVSLLITIYGLDIDCACNLWCIRRSDSSGFHWQRTASTNSAMDIVFPWLQVQASGATTSSEWRIETCWMGKFRLGANWSHNCLSCIRPRWFAFSSGKEPSGRKVQRHTLRSASCTAPREPWYAV